MKKALSITFPLWLCAAPALAQVSFGVSATGGPLAYVVETEAQQRWEGKATLATVGADMAFDNGFYVGVQHAAASGGDMDFSFRGTPGSSSKFKRSDSTLTFGFAAANRLNSFFGIKSARTDIANVVDTRFSTQGYFVGLSYPIGFGASTLALTGAAGYNKGRWRDTTGDIQDSALGYSGGLKFAYAFSPRIVAGIGAKVQRYDYDFTAIGYGTLSETLRLVDVSLAVNF